MRKRQARAEQPDRVEIIDDAVREIRIGPGALITRLQQMHVDAPPGSRRGFRDRFEQRRCRPLHAVRPILHVEHRTMRGRGNRIDERELFRRPAMARRMNRAVDLGAGIGGQRVEDRLGRAIDQRIAVAHRHRKADTHADVARGPRHFLRLGRKIGQPLDARVMHHHDAGAAERAARQRNRAGEIRIGRRRQREIVQPDFQRLAGGAVRAGAGGARVVVRVGERRHRQKRLRCSFGIGVTAAMRSPSMRIVLAP